MPHNCMLCTVFCLYVPCNSIFCKAHIFCISQYSVLSPVDLPFLAISTFQLLRLILTDNCHRSVADYTLVYRFVITNNGILMSLFDQKWDPFSEHACYKFICGTNIYFLRADIHKITVRVIGRRNPPAVRYNADGLLRTPLAEV
jgi:hypothetical protein